MKKIVLSLCLSAFLTFGFAQGTTKSGKTVYPGDHHTTSHGGTYQGGSSSPSHKGGHYTNPPTSNHYGTHKKK
jgi:hypothetical protein